MLRNLDAVTPHGFSIAFNETLIFTEDIKYLIEEKRIHHCADLCFR